MVWRFRTPLKEAPVWNVLITSICKESESETALLHSQREVGKRGREGPRGFGEGMERAGERGQDVGSQRESLTHKTMVRRRGKKR